MIIFVHHLHTQLCRWRFLLVAVLLLGLPQTARSEAASESETALSKAIKEIHQTYEKIQDLQADFVQTVEIQGFDTTYVSTGKVFIKKGKMLWDYIEPGKQMIYVNDGGFEYYVPDHKQVIRSRVGGQSDSHLPLQLLSGLGRLDQDFKVSFAIEPPKPGEAVHLKLVPNNNMGLIHIDITVIPSSQIKGLVIDQVVLYEQNGNISTSIFEKVKINQGLNDTLFDFEIPDDVEVIDGP